MPVTHLKCTDSLPGNMPNGSAEHDPFGDASFTDCIVAEWKKQSPEGCVLCLLDEWDAADWD